VDDPHRALGSRGSKTNRLVIENSSILRNAAAASSVDAIPFGDRVMTEPAVVLKRSTPAEVARRTSPSVMIPARRPSRSTTPVTPSASR